MAAADFGPLLHERWIVHMWEMDLDVTSLRDYGPPPRASKLLHSPTMHPPRHPTLCASRQPHRPVIRTVTAYIHRSDPAG